MKKPLRWFAVVALSIAVFGAIAAALVSTLGTLEHRSAAERFVAEDGPLEPEKYAPESVPDVENATRLIQKGADASGGAFWRRSVRRRLRLEDSATIDYRN